jgi:hypothetical protein
VQEVGLTGDSFQGFAHLFQGVYPELFYEVAEIQMSIILQISQKRGS